MVHPFLAGPLTRTSGLENEGTTLFRLKIEPLLVSKAIVLGGILHTKLDYVLNWIVD